MWEFLQGTLTTFLQGGPGAIFLILLAVIAGLSYIVYKLMQERKEFTKTIETFMKERSTDEDEKTEFLMEILNRYHDDRAAITKALTDLREALSRIMGKLF